MDASFDVITTIFVSILSVVVLLIIFLTANIGDVRVVSHEIGSESALGNGESQARSMRHRIDYKSVDFCDEELCEFEGDVRKHVACVKVNVKAIILNRRKLSHNCFSRRFNRFARPTQH